MNATELMDEYDKALSMYEKILAFELDAGLRSNIYRKMGDILMESSKLGDRRECIRRAIDAYGKALGIYRLEHFPEQYARIQSSLGLAFSSLAELEDDAGNLKRAALAYDEALKVYVAGNEPRCLSQIRLGDVCSALAELVDTPENCRRAIHAYCEVIKSGLLGFAADRARVQSSLGIAYRRLAEYGDRAVNCKLAIQAFEEALKVYAREGNFALYADAQTNLGNAYATLADAEDEGKTEAESCRAAIDAYGRAIEVYTIERYPSQYASVQTNLAIAYIKLSEVEDQAENCKRAVRACQEALLVRRPGSYQSAATQNNLGNAYISLAEVEEGAENCQKAVQAYQSALESYPHDRYAFQRAAAENNLGNAYLILAGLVDRAENCKKAIKACNQSLEVYTKENFPRDYAHTQSLLWLAYTMLAQEEYRAENCARAVRACQETLSIYQEGDPGRASAQKDMAIAYSMLAEAETGEEKAEDCKKAISICNELLSIYPPDKQPMEHAEILTMIWSAFTSLAEVEDKVGNCLNAAEACEKAIEIYAKSSPDDWANCQKNLGYTYITLAEAQDKAVNCKRAVLSYQPALEIYTPERSLSDYADIQRDLGYTYITLSEVDDCEANCKKAIKAYKRAFKAYSDLSSDEGDSISGQFKLKAERCQRAMESCKRAYKSAKRLERD